MKSLNFPSLVGYIVASPLLPPLGKQAYEYIFAGNGIFLRAANAHFVAQLCLHTWPAETVRGLPPLEPYLTLHHPRLPRVLLRHIIRDARSRHGNAGQLQEALYRVVFQEQDGMPPFALDMPPQQASTVSVTAAAPTGAVVLELHSHGAMSAFWSQTDDRDEGGMGIYGVLGHLDKEQVEIRLRVGVYGYWWEVPLGMVFDMDTTTVEEVRETETTITERLQVKDLNAGAPAPLARFCSMTQEDA